MKRKSIIIWAIAITPFFILLFALLKVDPISQNSNAVLRKQTDAAIERLIAVSEKWSVPTTFLIVPANKQAFEDCLRSQFLYEPVTKEGKEQARAIISSDAYYTKNKDLIDSSMNSGNTAAMLPAIKELLDNGGKISDITLPAVVSRFCLNPDNLINFRRVQ